MKEREIKVGWVDGDKVKVVKYIAGVGVRGPGRKREVDMGEGGGGREEGEAST